MNILYRPMSEMRAALTGAVLNGLCPGTVGAGRLWLRAGQRSNGRPARHGRRVHCSNRARRHATLHFGDYELQEEMSAAAWAVVYRARQVSLNRTVGGEDDSGRPVRRDGPAAALPARGRGGGAVAAPEH